jgi:hypothetical protein
VGFRRKQKTESVTFDEYIFDIQSFGTNMIEHMPDNHNQLKCPLINECG